MLYNGPFPVVLAFKMAVLGLHCAIGGSGRGVGRQFIDTAEEDLINWNR